MFHPTGKALFILATLVLTGCVTPPPAVRDNPNSREALAAHVAFLAQPALKGREPHTAGSRLARKYIEDRFKACGLVPWAQTKSYELSFGFGRNLVGVLPGTDTNEGIVILSAHYDHLGKEGGKIHPGASDNASGVAALLETARQLSRAPQRPKRSIAFVAFDCEEKMLLGSLAFTCRDDVQTAKIAAVVNVDMLGRDFMDVVTNTLFVTGTENYPSLRKSVPLFGDANGMRVLLVGTDLAGPRSDHASFESLSVPCLFFTCGVFRDYHEPGDTPDKLNYDNINRSTRVILQTVRELADAGPAVAITNSASGDLDELRTLTTVLAEVLSQAKTAGISTKDIGAFQKIENRAEELLRNGQYTRQMREDLVLDTIGTLTPYLEPGGLGNSVKPEQEQLMSVALQIMQYLDFNFRTEMMDEGRRLAAQLVKYQPGAFRSMPKFTFKVVGVSDHDIDVAETAPGLFELHALIWRMDGNLEVKRSKWLVNSSAGNLNASVTDMYCVGSKEQLTDCCLLSLRETQDNPAGTAEVRKVFRVVSGTAATESYSNLLARRLVRGGFQNENEWITNCILSGTPTLARLTLGSTADHADATIRQVAARVMADPGQSADIRTAAISLVAKSGDKPGLLAICNLVNDPTPYHAADYDPLIFTNNPFADRTIMRVLRPVVEKLYAEQKDASGTIGRVAREELKRVTKKDYGTDATRWQQWIETHAFN